LVCQLINTGGVGLTGPAFSLINNNSPTGSTGSTGETGPTGPTGPATNVNISYLSNTGYTGPTFPGSTGTYFLDSVNLGPINVTNVNNKYLINASCQILSTSGISNVSSSILRSNSLMSGTSLPAQFINLANNSQSDVIYPPLHSGSASLNDLNTSLWSISTSNPGSQSLNGTTIIMQAYDTGFPSTGNYYYAIRVDTDQSILYYGNIRLSYITFN
jgi:hypothetical protein